ncbi:MAG TPA: hypothetical protein DHM42_03255 [Clostridiales bacterium]|jgi:hypothetical protein|nr:hypothetical protein [Clostridiales bacterium]
MYRKILSWFLVFVMVFAAFGGITKAAYAQVDPECKIGEVSYETIGEAITASVDGDIITLLKNVNHTGKITISGKKITFDLNGFNLDVSNTGDTTVEVGLGGEIDLIGEGEFNVSGTGLATTGYYDNRGTITISNGKMEVTNVYSYGDSGYPAYGIYLSEGSINVLNNVEVTGQKRAGVYTTGINSSATVNNNVKSSIGAAIQLYDNSSITVLGNVEGGYGIDANNSTAIVKGDAIGVSDGARAMSGAQVYIGGNATSSSNNSYGAYSTQENSFISVSGSAISYGDYSKGTFAGAGGEALIMGNSESRGNDGDGVYAVSNATVIIKGNVVSENGTGVWAWHNDSDKPYITVDGEMVAETFIEFDRNENITVYNKDDYTTPTTKEGYFTYTDGYSTVWMSYPPVWGIEIESTDMYPFGGGDGTSEETAFEISTANQLSQLAYNVNNGNNYSGKYFKLKSDIDLSNKEWVPIGKDYNHRFMGNFDGDNFKIEGLTITKISYSENYGLFGYLGENGSISNLVIESGKIELTEDPSNNSGIGGVAGYSTGLISNCTNKLDIIADHNSEIYAGGIVGLGNSDIRSYSWSGKIENCHNEGNITLGDRGSAGGIIGVQFNSNSYTFLRNSSNEGNITGGRSVEVGGIAGRLNGSGFRDNPVINCYNNGNLITGTLTPDTSIAGDIGGIVGYLYNGTVENSFNTGDIEVLYSDTTNTSGFYIGGIVGYGGPPYIYNSYNTGKIIGPEDRVGPMSGANGYYTAHTNCYYMEGSVPNSLINTGATKLTENQMKGIDASTISFINSSDEEVTYGPANGAFIHALNYGKSEEAFSWYYDERYNDGYPILYYNNETPNVISFDSQGGTSVPAVTMKVGDSINTSPITSKEVHTFKGWFTKSEKGIEISFPFEPIESIVLYAQWTADEEPEEPSTTTRPSVPKLEIETEMLPDGVQGEEYQLELEGEGGREPYNWSAEGLPEGLSISEEGKISGTPEESGIFSVKIELLDSRNYYRSGVYDLEIVKDESEGEESKEDSFSDINEHWAIDYIEGIMEKDVINGYPDGTFRPNNNVTREEFASLLVRVLDLEKNSDMTFEDALNRWSTEDVSTAAYHDIVKGYNETSFGPADLITREQMAVMIARALGLEAAEIEVEFKDIEDISQWAKPSVLSVLNKGLIEGYPDGSFRPKDYLTRAEAVKVLYFVMEELD